MLGDIIVWLWQTSRFCLECQKYTYNSPNSLVDLTLVTHPCTAGLSAYVRVTVHIADASLFYTTDCYHDSYGQCRTPLGIYGHVQANYDAVTTGIKNLNPV